MIKIDDKLVEEIKLYLSITWDDPITNSSIQDYIRDGMDHLQVLAGDPEIDFFSDIEAKKLLKEYCRYARNNSAEYFNANFSDDILRFQINHAIKDYVATSDLQ